MTRPRLRMQWWSVTGLYLLFTFATLGMAPLVWNTLNKALEGQGVTLFYAIYVSAAVVIVFYFIAHRKEKKLHHYLLLVLFMAVFFLMLQQEKNPGEKVHMAQYGVLGILLYKALSVDFGRHNCRLYLNGAAISLIAGEIDEIIQGLLPNRWFTWHDVFINGFSSILALFIIGVVVSGKLQERGRHVHKDITRGERLLMGVLSFWPGLHLVFLGLILALQAMGNLNPVGSRYQDLAYPLIYLAFGWCVVLVPCCMVYIWNAVFIKGRKKYLWFLVLITGNIVMMPIFWFFHILHTEEIRMAS